MHTSKHRVNDELVEIGRDWKPEHVDAGYHEHEWGEHSHDAHELLGQHGSVLVEHLDEDFPEGVGGPVFKITLPAGDIVTVLCADTVRAYLEQHGVAV